MTQSHYALERDMIPDLVEALPNLLGPTGPRVLAAEVPEGPRVLDLVMAWSDVRPDDDYAVAGLKAISRLSNSQRAVLAVLWSSGRSSVDRLSRRTFIDAERLLDEHLRPMQRAGLVGQIGSRSWIVTLSGSLTPRTVIAVEAKLYDWRCALRQAHDNRRRADYSYVALPDTQREKSSAIYTHARAIGVGVIEVSPTGSRIAVKARRGGDLDRAARLQMWMRLAPLVPC